MDRRVPVRPQPHKINGLWVWLHDPYVFSWHGLPYSIVNDCAPFPARMCYLPNDRAILHWYWIPLYG